jgi:hypothetical protein
LRGLAFHNGAFRKEERGGCGMRRETQTGQARSGVQRRGERHAPGLAAVVAVAGLGRAGRGLRALPARERSERLQGVSFLGDRHTDCAQIQFSCRNQKRAAPLPT